MHQAFFKAFVAEFGKMPTSQTALRAYDSAALFVEAFKRAKSANGSAVRDQLANLSGFEGLAGTFDFRNGNGEGIREARMFAIKNGKDILLVDYLKTMGK
jgi:branched-chain amino acid transport system substrate-binding protein